MRNFKLYLNDKNTQILLTEFNEQEKANPSPASTYNEQLKESENSQYTLTFSIAKFLMPGEINPFAEKIHFNSRLKLIMDSYETEIDFVINSIQPQIYKNNIIYNISAQDEVSWWWSRRNLGYSYSNAEEDENGNIIGVQTIYEIARKVLIDCGLSNSWGVEEDQFSDLFTRKTTLIVDNSNPYNVIIEACNSFNAYLMVDYHNHLLKFYRRDSVGFSGYRYFPETNLKTFNVNGSSDNFISILHVTGGTNEYDEQVTMVPGIPDLLAKWLSVEDNFAAILDNAENNYHTDGKIDWGKIGSKVAETNPYNQYLNLSKPQQAIILGTDEQGASIEESSIIGQQKIKEYNDSINEIYEEEKTKLKTFIEVAKQVPHLGQFLYDFSYFQKTNQINDKQLKQLVDQFDTQMLKYNLYLKLYTPQYYQLQWNIMSWENRYKVAAENYVVLQQQLQQAQANNTDAKGIAEIIDELAQVTNTLKTLIKENDYAYARNIVALGENYEEHYSKWLNEKISLYINLYNEKKKDLDKLICKKANTPISTENNLTYEEIQINSEIEAAQSLLDTYKTLAGNYWKDDKGRTITPLYPFMLDILENTEIPSSIKSISISVDDKPYNLTTLLAYCNSKIQQIWNTIYSGYGSYIVEGQYENSDELDSISLFNQAITYYDSLNRPEITYSAAVLDLGALERIDVPRVKIGAKIKVYNQMLNYVDAGENNLDYRDNSLLVTGITTTLRTPGSVSLTVSRQQWYKDIVEKLLKAVAN